MDYTTILAIGILIVVVMFGPQKIPDLARSLGRARREFDQASRGDMIDLSQSNEVKLQAYARSHGIETQGKTINEIVEELGRVEKS